ncbi:MAG: 3-oxoacyl-ACP reductase FabG [Euryarchaeota archaeon]|nr:3-oxoacyl-ACP reductase FabG [Euryarchaeota archaeon]
MEVKKLRLENKVAIITGSAKGIGREAALLFAEEGAKVVVIDVDEGGSETAEEIKNMGHESLFVKTDVCNKEQVQDMVKKVVERFGKIDVLINNAGIIRDSTLLKMTEEQWDKVIDTNLKGVFNCTQAVAEVMVKQGYGKIINTSSIVALYGNFGQANYAASKAGLIGFTKTLAKELGRKGIRVNAVAPGFVLTDMVRSVPEKVLEMVKEKTPIGRLGQPKDIANVYLFLASDESDYINGAVLSVDGGLTL